MNDHIHAELARYLSESMARPITAPGSAELAQRALAQFPDTGLSLPVMFADKLLQTLEDGRRHDTMALPPGGTGVAVWFNAWPGLHREVQAERYGVYLGELCGKAHWLVERGVRISGFLQIDAYIGDDDESLDLEVEYSYLPGGVVGGTRAAESWWNVIVLNQSLCTVEERQAIEKFMA